MPDTQPSAMLPPGDDALDPEIRVILEDWRARMSARPPMESVSPSDMRVRAAAEFAAWNQDGPPIANVRDMDADGVPVRLYDPVPGGKAGVMVYMHGGGWVVGDLDFEDATLRRMAARGGIRILSVDYRLAPEHPFPAALEDVETVVRWAASGPGGLDIGPARIALGGASAGANLALGAALRLRDFGGVTPCFLLLMYGAYSGGLPSASYALFADGRFGLPRAVMDWFWMTYAGADPERYDSAAVPLKADLRGLPPVFLNHAELDLLRDDSIALAEQLADAEVPFTHQGYAGAIHGFTQYAKGSALARRALDDAADAVAAALG